MKPLAPNTTLQDRYKITEMIGKGGMGEVYLAIDQRLGHSIALKRTTVGDDDLLTEAFEREARTLAQLRHSILPKVSDHFIENGEQYLVMEYISGEDLSERLKETNKAFPLNWVMFWADQLLDALAFLHTYDPPIIHRDIKPQNLKLTSENHIVLLDFGLSKNTLGKTQVTNSGSVLGYTPHYASMEQIRGTGTNARSDIFSLSATLYHLVSNETPPDALTRADAMLSGSPDPLKPLTELNPEINDTISKNILKGMEISQDKRFKTARDMQKALRRAYNEMQKSMSAQTLTFNNNAVGVANLENSDIGNKTEVMADMPLQTEEVPAVENSNPLVGEFTESDENLDPTLVGGYRPDDVSAEKTEVIEAEEFKAAIGDRDLNATVEFNGQVADSIVDKTNEDIPAIVPDDDEEYKTIQDIPIAESAFKTEEDFSTSEDFALENFKTSEDVSLKESAKSEATAPMIPLEDKAIESQQNTESVENVGDANWGDSFVSENVEANDTEQNDSNSLTAGVGLTDNFSKAEVEEDSNETSQEVLEQNVKESSYIASQQTTTTNAPPPRVKSSAGKYIAMLGGLGVVLLLLIGTALGIGYYYTNGTFGFGSDGTTTTENETETKPDTANPEVESKPEATDNETTKSTETTTDSENDGETVAIDENTEADSTDNSSDSTETTTKPTGTKTTNTTKKNTTVTAKPNTKTSAKKTNTKPRTKRVKKTTKPPTKKTSKPPIKKTTKKDAGVL